MTRELNVRITLSEDHMAWTDEEYVDIITDAIEEKTTNYQVCVEVETVKPESEKK